MELDFMEYANDAAAQDAYKSSDRWEETFEQDIINQDPSRWTVAEPGTSDVKVITGKYCYLDAIAGDAGMNVTLPFIKSAGEFEIKAKVGQTDKHFTVYLYEGAVIKLRIAFFTDGHFKYVDGGWINLPTDTTYVADTWYTIKIKWYIGNTWDVWIGGVSKGTGLAFESSMSVGLDKILMRFAGSPTANATVDDVIIGDSLTSYLQAYSESTIKEQGSYSLKGVAKQTGSLNETLTRAI